MQIFKKTLFLYFDLTISNRMFSSCRDVTIASQGMQDLGLYLGKKFIKTHLICALYVALKSEDKFHYHMFGAL